MRNDRGIKKPKESQKYAETRLRRLIILRDTQAEEIHDQEHGTV